MTERVFQYHEISGMSLLFKFIVVFVNGLAWSIIFKKKTNVM